MSNRVVKSIKVLQADSNFCTLTVGEYGGEPFRAFTGAGFERLDEIIKYLSSAHTLVRKEVPAGTTEELTWFFGGGFAGKRERREFLVVAEFEVLPATPTGYSMGASVSVSGRGNVPGKF